MVGPTGGPAPDVLTNVNDMTAESGGVFSRIYVEGSATVGDYS